MIISLILLVLTVIGLYITTVIFLNNKTNPVNVSFSFITLSASIWPFAIFMFRMSTTVSEALFWDRIIYLGGSIFPCAFLFFSKIFPNYKNKVSPIIKNIIFLSFIIIALSLFMGNSFIDKILLNNFGNGVNLSLAYYIWSVWFGVFIAWGFINLLRNYKNSDRLGKMQLVYILLAIGIPASLALPFNVIMPMFGNYSYIWVGPIFILIMILIVAYAITHYRLMDIRLLLKNTLVYVVALNIVLIAGMVMVYIANNFLKLILPDVIAEILILIITVASFQPVRNFVKKIADVYLYNHIYSYQEALRRLSSETTKIIELEELADVIIDTLMKSIGLNRAGMILISQHHPDASAQVYNVSNNIGFDSLSGEALLKNDFLTNYFNNNRKALVYEEITLMLRDENNHEPKQAFHDLRQYLKKIQAEVCLPLFLQKKLLGIIILGNKISNEAYTQEDIELLEALSNQSSVAISNAVLYQQVKDAQEKLENFNKSLQKEVNDATLELRSKNKELEGLLKMKSEFLTVASHQLRTPTSIVRGMLSMLSEEEENLTPAQRKEFIDQAYASINRLERIVHEMLSASELEGGPLSVTTESIDLYTITKNSAQLKKSAANKKNLQLTFFEPKQELPRVLGSKHKIEDIVDNLIDNAINYSLAGEIKVMLGTENNYVWLKVIDEGIGLTTEDEKVLFERFKRGEKAVRLYPNGSGLGLFIAKGVLESLGGKIEVISGGKGRGSTFIIYLPIAK
ncbi:MAG: ATP-binding protein [Patescibacteria group bacterium]